jgi:hypothetical protein
VKHSFRSSTQGLFGHAKLTAEVLGWED